MARDSRRPLHLAIALVALLASPVAGTAKGPEPINLARTSLTAVSAASVSQFRPLEDPEHGILNAFDGRSGPPQDATSRPWTPHLGLPAQFDEDAVVEVHFEVPVSVKSVLADTPVYFSVTLIADDGTETTRPGKGSIAFDPPARAIREARFSFDGYRQAPHVYEIEIRGHLPPGTGYEVASPRLVPNEEYFERAADQAFYRWAMELARTKRRTVRRTAEEIVYVYFARDVPLMKLTLDRRLGTTTVESYAAGSPPTSPVP